MTTLTWYGHSCFKLECGSGSVIFDPYAPGSVPGIELPALQADTVICSHSHSDHNYAAGVQLTGKSCGITFTQFDTWHDDRQGSLRGKNTITVADTGKMRVLHLGDLGHELTDEQVRALGRIDVLLIPIGGFYTIDAAAARRVADKIGAGITIPMHYKGEGFGYDVIAAKDAFMRISGNVVLHDSNAADLENLAAPVTLILRCPLHKG